METPTTEQQIKAGVSDAMQRKYRHALELLEPLVGTEYENHEMQYWLAVVYRDYGRNGGIVYYKKAKELYRKSAKQGNWLAQFEFGEMYEEGLGVVKSLIHAYMWYIIAGNNVDEREFENAGFERLGQEKLESLKQKIEDMENSQEFTGEDMKKAQVLAVRAINSGYTTDDC